MELANDWSGVYLGMWADDLLKIHPNKEFTKDPTIFDSGVKCKRNQPLLIVTYHYSEADVTLEYATVDDKKYGKISVYAVQKIELKDESNGHNGKNSKHKGENRRAKRRRKRRQRSKVG